jgi:hypothetical protein
LLLVASFSNRLTSASVRCSRPRSLSLAMRFGRLGRWTVPFSSPGTTGGSIRPASGSHLAKFLCLKSILCYPRGPRSGPVVVPSPSSNRPPRPTPATRFTRAALRGLAVQALRPAAFALKDLTAYFPPRGFYVHLPTRPPFAVDTTRHSPILPPIPRGRLTWPLHGRGSCPLAV